MAESFEPDDPGLAESLKGLGPVYFERNRFEAAEPLLERATEGTAHQ